MRYFDPREPPVAKVMFNFETTKVSCEEGAGVDRSLTVESTTVECRGTAGEYTTPILNDMLEEEPTKVKESGVATNSDDTSYTVPPEKRVGSFESALPCHNLGFSKEGNATTGKFEEVKHGPICE